MCSLQFNVQSGNTILNPESSIICILSFMLRIRTAPDDYCHCWWIHYGEKCWAEDDKCLDLSKNSQFTVIKEERNEKICKYKKLKLENLDFFSVKKHKLVGDQFNQQLYHVSLYLSCKPLLNVLFRHNVVMFSQLCHFCAVVAVIEE